MRQTGQLLVRELGFSSDECTTEVHGQRKQKAVLVQQLLLSAGCLLRWYCAFDETL